MATNDVVSGLFGLSPYQVQQQRYTQDQAAAERMAKMSAIEMGNMGLMQGGAGLARLGAGAMGMVDPAVIESQKRQSAMSDADLSTPEGMISAAQKFNQMGMPKEAFLLTQKAKELQSSAAKSALDLRKQEFKEGEELDFRREQAKGALENRQLMLQMMLQDKALGREQQERLQKMMMDNQRTIKQMDIDARMREAQLKAKQGGMDLTPGQIQLDKEFAKDYADYSAGGGYATVAKNLTQLADAKKELEADASLTGPGKGYIPEGVRAITNARAVAVKNRVEEVVQSNLRIILGSQFTKEEGERLIARAYNPDLKASENAKRVGALITQLNEMAKAKQDASDYFEKNGTLTGWKGRLPTKSDVSTLTEDRPKATDDLRKKYNLGN